MHPHNDIEKRIESHAPSLSQDERVQLWEVVASKLPGRDIAPAHSRFTFAFPYPRQAVALAFIFILVLVGGGTVLASGAARPGDILFPVERTVETVQLQLARNGEKRQRLSEQFSEERVQELRSIIGEETGGKAVHYENLSGAGSERVGIAIDEVATFLDTTRFDDAKKVRVYTEVFGEIENLKLDVAIDEAPGDTKERVRIKTNEEGESRIEIHRKNERVRIEKKDGEVRVRNEAWGDGDTPELDDDVENETHDRNSVRATEVEEENIDNTGSSDDSGYEDAREEDSDDSMETEDEQEEKDAQEVSKLEVRVKHGVAEVRASMGHEQDEFELPYVSHESLVASLASRFDVTQEKIEHILDIEKE